MRLATDKKFTGSQLKLKQTSHSYQLNIIGLKLPTAGEGNQLLIYKHDLGFLLASAEIQLHLNSERNMNPRLPY